MSEHVFSDIGLLAKVRELITLRTRTAALHEAMKSAEEAWKVNSASIEQIREELGNHTKTLNKPEIVMVDGMACFIPVPPTGYTNYKVEVVFTHPVGVSKQ